MDLSTDCTHVWVHGALGANQIGFNRMAYNSLSELSR